MIVNLVLRRYNDGMNVDDGQDLLERLYNLLRMEVRAFGAKSGLQPVQIEALSYLARCNRYSDTPQAVTEFLGLTKGTVSQSLKLLEEKGLLRKHQDTEDKRVTHLVLTAKGRKLVEQAYSVQNLNATLARTHAGKSKNFEETLRWLLREMQHLHGRRTFAACHTCRFNERHNRGYVCGLTKEALSERDVQMICREHEYPS